MASVTVNLTGYQEFTNYIRWPDNVVLGAAFAADGQSQTLNFADLNEDVPAGRVSLSIVGFNRRFTPEFEAAGRIIFEASDGELLEVSIADADMTETYAWVPTNSAEVIAFVLHVRGLTDGDATLTLTDEPDVPVTTTTYEVRVKATASGFTDSEYSDPPETIDVTP